MGGNPKDARGCSNFTTLLSLWIILPLNCLITTTITIIKIVIAHIKRNIICPSNEHSIADFCWLTATWSGSASKAKRNEKHSAYFIPFRLNPIAFQWQLHSTPLHLYSITSKVNSPAQLISRIWFVFPLKISSFYPEILFKTTDGHKNNSIYFFSKEVYNFLDLKM